MNKEKAYKQLLENDSILNDSIDILESKMKLADNSIRAMLENSSKENRSEMERVYSFNLELKNLAKKGDVNGLHELSQKILEGNGSKG